MTSTMTWACCFHSQVVRLTQKKTRERGLFWGRVVPKEKVERPFRETFKSKAGQNRKVCLSVQRTRGKPHRSTECRGGGKCHLPTPMSHK